MSRNPSHRWPTTREIAQEDRVENRVKKFMARMPHDAAAITSVRVAIELANLWEVENSAMERRGDQRLAYYSTEEDRRWLVAAVAASSKSLAWQSCEYEYVGRMFTDELPPDVAAYLSHKVARSICWKERF